MRKIKFKRICPYYDDFVFTQTDLNQNVLASGIIVNLRAFRKIVAKNISNEPCEVVASYTIKFIDTWTVPLLPYEIQDEQKYGAGHPVVHSVKKQLKVWMVTDEEQINTVIGHLKKEHKSSVDILIVNKKMQQVYPHRSLDVPFQIRNFLFRRSIQHRR